MEVGEFLLASGFALLIVLIGWSNQITSRSKETRELEKEFIDKAKVKRKDYKSMINKGKSAKKAISALIDFLYSKRDESDIKAFDKITKIKKDLVLLNKNYAIRFWILIITSISFMISGTIFLILEEPYKIYSVLHNIIFIICIIFNLIKTYRLEKRYSENIYEVMEGL